MAQQDFLLINQEYMGTLGFWSENYRSSIIIAIESLYAGWILQKWTITDFIVNGDKVLLKWVPRTFELSATEVAIKYHKNEQ